MLKIPIWRGCAAAHESVNDCWLPAIDESMKDKGKGKQEQESHCNEEDEEDKALTELFRKSMMDIPWVKAAARVAKRQEKAKNKQRKKQKSEDEKEQKSEGKKKQKSKSEEL